MEYRIADFRADMRNAFDTADAGVDVTIDRYGVRYWLITDDYMQELLKGDTPIVTVSTKTTGPTIEPVLLPAKIPQMRLNNGLCKIHGTPLDDRGKCLMKGCKYA